jgi:hypothetical protein
MFVTRLVLICQITRNKPHIGVCGHVKFSTLNSNYNWINHRNTILFWKFKKNETKGIS